jgi:hypothetical protein
MGQQGVRHDLASAAHRIDRTTEVDGGVPQCYGGGDQGKPVRAMLLRFDGPVPQLAEPMEADSARERIPGLALVQFRGCLSPELWLFQPVQGVKRALDTTDLA